MRISLDRGRLLGFELQADLTAKVGSKTQGICIPTASHNDIAKTAPASATLTFPSRTA